MKSIRAHIARVLLGMLALLLLAAPGARAEAVKTFGVLPFTINGPEKYNYLSRGVQDMLLSRLYWKDHVVSVDKGALKDVPAPQDNAAAEAARGSLKVDYLVWGSLTIMGKQASLDVTGLGPDGKNWTNSEQTDLDKLIPALDGLAKRINADLFGREAPAMPASVAQEEPKEQVQVMNPGLVYNQVNRNQEFYLNPEFRYAGDSDNAGRIQSQRMPFKANGMIVADVDGDGVSEVVLIEDSHVHLFRLVDRQLRPVATYDASPSLRCLNINALDVDRDGRLEIVITAVEKDITPKSFILNVVDGRFVEIEKDIKYFLGVTNPAPEFMPVFVGQRRQPNGLFEPKVYEMLMTPHGVTEGKRMFTPENGNVFNQTFLPYKSSYKIVQTDADDRLKVFTPTGDMQYRTDEIFSGSAVGVEYYSVMRGLNKSYADMSDYYYVPIRSLAVDLDGNRQYELLVNHPISIASQLFGRYRSFPQGEIHALFWDGVGLNLQWKTRRIKGSVRDFAVADADGDGNLDLCVCVTTHPGTSGLAAVKTMVLFYPLNTEKISAPVHKEFKEE
ncbi:MAG: VCBS repeat-containing protein [Desulfovibrionaceae bacterium]|jgi:hypothetical protein|nr:VCBS repeat-containing protein [Desulfovibrionaceae bacterium]